MECKRNSYGCKVQLLITKMILENCCKSKRNLSTAWIDYKKAIDSVSHEWILKAPQLYKISPIISSFISINMTKWKTHLFLSYNTGTCRSDRLRIKQGIFQCDALSPLPFCMAIIPLSSELNNTDYGYRTFETKVNQLFYLGSLNLFARNDYELEGLLTTAKGLSNGFEMEFKLDKCAKASFLRGTLKKTANMNLVIRDYH